MANQRQAMAGNDIDLRMRRDIEQLARLNRRTSTPGERRSAEWIASRLSGDIGAADTATAWFRTQSSWAPTHLVYLLAAIVAGAVSGLFGRLLGAGVTACYELEVSGRNQWVRRLLPAKRGVSVTARIAAAGDTRRTLVLVAHHDAAHNGAVWHPRTVALNRMLSQRTGETLPTHFPVLIAMAASALRMRRVRIAARFVLAVVGLASIQSMRSRTTPGANDNGTGVAAVLEVARRIRERPFPDTEVLLVFPGGEEVGNVGMRAWADNDGRRLDPTRTLVINLDSLGSGGHLVAARREGLTGKLTPSDVALAMDVASGAGINLRVVSFPNVCDTSIARYKGMHAISLLSYDDGWIRNLHLKSDTVDEIGWNTVHDAVALTEQLALAWARTASPA
ncbi:M28 family metallopeptidase [Mycolicibacterium sp. XJ870]